MEQMRKQGGVVLLNPKIFIIIDQFFPQIINHHIRTRSPEQEARKSLERYREIGYRTIERLPPEQQELNRQILDDAFASSLRQLEEFHAREEGNKGKESHSNPDTA